MHSDMTRPIFEVPDARDVANDAGAETSRSGLAGQDFFWIALVGSIAAFMLLVFKPNRARLRETEAEKSLLRSEIASLEQRVARLRAWERSLSSGDAAAWSSLARERLGWLAPGEVLLPVAHGGPLPEGDAKGLFRQRGCDTVQRREVVCPTY